MPLFASVSQTFNWANTCSARSRALIPAQSCAAFRLPSTANRTSPPCVRSVSAMACSIESSTAASNVCRNAISLIIKCRKAREGFIYHRPVAPPPPKPPPPPLQPPPPPQLPPPPQPPPLQPRRRWVQPDPP